MLINQGYSSPIQLFSRDRKVFEFPRGLPTFPRTATKVFCCPFATCAFPSRMAATDLSASLGVGRIACRARRYKWHVLEIGRRPEKFSAGGTSTAAVATLQDSTANSHPGPTHQTRDTPAAGRVGGSETLVHPGKVGPGLGDRKKRDSKTWLTKSRSNNSGRRSPTMWILFKRGVPICV